MGFQKSISYKNPRHGAPGPIGTSKSIGHICKSSENYSFTVYKCQHAEITLVFVPTSIFTFFFSGVH